MQTFSLITFYSDYTLKWQYFICMRLSQIYHTFYLFFLIFNVDTRKCMYFKYMAHIMFPLDTLLCYACKILTDDFEMLSIFKNYTFTGSFKKCTRKYNVFSKDDILHWLSIKTVQYQNDIAAIHRDYSHFPSFTCVCEFVCVCKGIKSCAILSRV